MNERWQKYFISVAELTAELSYCVRLKVGAVAVRDKRVICTGYNGTLPGMDNCCEIEIIDPVTKQPRLTTKDETEHAERNLIAHAARHGIALLDSSLFITHAPCMECAKAIVNAGFKNVYWRNIYRSPDGLELLQRHKIATFKV